MSEKKDEQFKKSEIMAINDYFKEVAGTVERFLKQLENGTQHDAQPHTIEVVEETLKKIVEGKKRLVELGVYNNKDEASPSTGKTVQWQQRLEALKERYK